MSKKLLHRLIGTGFYNERKRAIRVVVSITDEISEKPKLVYSEFWIKDNKISAWRGYGMCQIPIMRKWGNELKCDNPSMLLI